MTGDDLAHLLPEARRAAALPDEERIALIEAAEWWIGYTRAEAVLARLRRLFRVGPGRLRPPNALLVAPSNNGKSTLIERFRREHEAPPDAGDGAEAEVIPVVVVQMPSEPTVSRFYATLLDKLGAPQVRRLGRGARKHDLERLSLDVLRGVQARVLVIDELHNLLAGRQDARREFLNLLRYLGNALRIPVVGAGTRDAYLAIRTDPQLENRFEPIALPLWEADVETATLIASFAASLPLRRPSPDLRRVGVLRAIVARSGGTIGEIMALMRAAAVAAIESGVEAITAGALDEAAYRGPGERRAQLERDLPRSAAA
jgi:Bacterial TniB protein